MKSFRLTGWVVGAAVISSILSTAPAAWGVSLDEEGTIKLGVRAYVNARIGTEKTDRTRFVDNIGGTPTFVKISETFPESAAGHLRQNRFFLEAELEHDLTKLMRQGFGPLSLLNDLPFSIDHLKYHLTYRGEGEGIYDWGPSEYRNRDALFQLLGDASGTIDPPRTCQLEICPDIQQTRSDLHDKASNRQRLFQAYIDWDIGNLFLRTGRQILVWGETDNFRLIDNINPIDSSFGGFLIDLDERRVPIDMVRGNYYIGDVSGGFSEMYLEGYVAIDSHVSYSPGVLPGSPWAFPNQGTPGGIPPGQTRTIIFEPARTFSNARGGARLVFNALDVTWSVAHYYTYADNPGVQTCVAPAFPIQKISRRSGLQSIPGCPVPIPDEPINQRPVCLSAGPDGQFGTGDDSPPGCRPPGSYDILAPTAYAIEYPARMQVSGATASFVVPAGLSRKIGLSGEPVVRTELAYFKDEPQYSQSQLDPFIYHFPAGAAAGSGPGTGGVLKRDSINFVLGIDSNQFIQFLNPRNSFFISTQFFYKHVKKAPDDLVLPVAEQYVVPDQARSLGAIKPIFARSAADQFLQTLFISTSYLGGKVEPNLTILYDWSGALAYIPSVTFLHDPFRFTLSADFLDAGGLKGNSGVSLLRDRDNVLFQLEYVI